MGRKHRKETIPVQSPALRRVPENAGGSPFERESSARVPPDGIQESDSVTNGQTPDSMKRDRQIRRRISSRPFRKRNISDRVPGVSGGLTFRFTSSGAENMPEKVSDGKQEPCVNRFFRCRCRADGNLRSFSCPSPMEKGTGQSIRFLLNSLIHRPI